MEGPTDNLSIENESGGGLEAPGRAMEGGTQAKSPEAQAPKTDSNPADKAYAAEPAPSGCPADTGCLAADGSQPLGMERSTALEPNPLVTTGLPQPSQAPAPERCLQRTPKASIADIDCLICFNQYSASRLPKLLACQHAFCAVCLKLILRNEDHTWIITCPLCRKSTVVFGGLIHSLRDKEDFLGWLDSPDPEAEFPCPPHPAGPRRTVHWSLPPRDEEPPRRNRAPTKRLVLLLLLLVMLIALILPFMYTGLLKWALCSAVILGLIISATLCCSPSQNCSDSSWLPWRRKESYIVSIA